MTTITTLNITTGSIRYLSARDGIITHWGTLPAGDITGNGLIRRPEAAGAQIKSLFVSERLPDDKVICSINGLPFSYRILTLPRMEAAVRDEAISRAARREMPSFMEDIHLSWQTYPVSENEWEVLVSGVTHRPIALLIDTLRHAGIKPYRLSLPHISLAKLTDKKDVVIVDFEADCSTVVLLAGGVPRAVHTVPSPGSEATLPDRAVELQRTVVKMLDYYNNSHHDSPFDASTEVPLTGELADSETANLLSGDDMPFNLELLSPEIDAPAGLPANTYAVNIGSMMLHSRQDKHVYGSPLPHRDINLRDIARGASYSEKIWKTARKMLLPAAVLLGVISLFLAFRFQAQANTEIDQLQAELASAGLEQAGLVESIDQANQLQATINDLAGDVTAVEQQSLYFSNAVNYVSGLSSMMESMPEGISFSSIELKETSIVLYGYAPDAHHIVEFADSLESSGNFTEANITWISKNNEGKTSTGGSLNTKFLLVISK
jgi:type IV pilus assembly protein PilM